MEEIKPTAISLFTAGVYPAIQLSHYLDFKLFTCHNENWKLLLNRDFPLAKVMKFSYNISKETVGELEVDWVIAVMDNYEEQVKEFKIPSKDGLFPPLEDDIEKEKLIVHRSSLLNVRIASKVVKAKYVLLIFKYNPFEEGMRQEDLFFMKDKKCSKERDNWFIWGALTGNSEDIIMFLMPKEREFKEILLN